MPVNPGNSRDAGKIGIRFIENNGRVWGGLQKFFDRGFLHKGSGRIVRIGKKENARLFPKCLQNVRQRKIHLLRVVQHLNARAGNLKELKSRLQAWSRLANDPADSPERRMARRIMGGVFIDSRSIDDQEYQNFVDSLRGAGPRPAK